MSQASVQTEIERVIEGASDALSDDIVERLGATVGEGLTLLDQVSRSNLEKAIPVIDRLVESGDLERAAGLLRVIGGASDALGDDIVGRLGEMVNELLCMADRIARNENLHKLLDLLEQDDVVDTLSSLCTAVGEVKKSSQTAAPTASLMSLVNTMKDPEVQQSLQMMSRFMMAFKES